MMYSAARQWRGSIRSSSSITHIAAAIRKCFSFTNARWKAAAVLSSERASSDRIARSCDVSLCVSIAAAALAYAAPPPGARAPAPLVCAQETGGRKNESHSRNQHPTF